MKIVGDTIMFKSTFDNFYKEKEGLKSCTIRRIVMWSELKAFEIFYNQVKNTKTARIIISCPETHESFERALTDISQFEGMWIFSWRQE